MKRKLPAALVMMILALVGLTRFTANVRDVQIVGLFACGALFGVGLNMMIRSFQKEA